MMYNPPHPGELLKEELTNYNVSITNAAIELGISRKHLSNIVNGKAAITPEIAKKLASYIGSSARMWLAMQASFDLWQLRNIHFDIKKIKAAQQVL